MENTLQVIEQTKSLTVMDDYALPLARVLQRVNLIGNVLHQVMQKDVHYGVIPGTGDKPSLLKPGAEKIAATFQLSPSLHVVKTELGNGHREYEVTCTLTHAPTGIVYGSGVGSCSTLEGKYRFRTGPAEPTGKPVPKAYWDTRDQALLGGKGFQAKKIDGKWEIVRQGEKVEHDNPADYYNTCLKMAKKRAFVDAVLTVTGASDVFTQDVEDMPEVIPGAKGKGTDGDDHKTEDGPIADWDKPKTDNDRKVEAAAEAAELTMEQVDTYAKEKMGKAFKDLPEGGKGVLLKKIETGDVADHFKA
jgi:hypothetical protein